MDPSPLSTAHCESVLHAEMFKLAPSEIMRTAVDKKKIFYWFFGCRELWEGYDESASELVMHSNRLHRFTHCFGGFHDTAFPPEVHRAAEKALEVPV